MATRARRSRQRWRMQRQACRIAWIHLGSRFVRECRSPETPCKCNVLFHVHGAEKCLKGANVPVMPPGLTASFHVQWWLLRGPIPGPCFGTHFRAPFVESSYRGAHFWTRKAAPFWGPFWFLFISCVFACSSSAAPFRGWVCCARVCHVALCCACSCRSAHGVPCYAVHDQPARPCRVLLCPACCCQLVRTMSYYDVRATASPCVPCFAMPCVLVPTRLGHVLLCLG